MVIVRLNDWEEFLAELRSHPPVDRIVRLTFSIRYDARTVPYLTMVVGYLDGASIVEFVHYLGAQPQDVSSDRAHEINTLFAERKKRLEDDRFVVKPGRYHLPPATTR